MKRTDLFINDKSLVVFDLDGTLIDSAEVVLSIINTQRTRMGKQNLCKNDLLEWISLGGNELISNSLEISIDEGKPYLQEFRDRYYEIKTPENSVYSWVLPSLNYLKEVGCRISICTNKPRILVEKILKETYLGDYFNFFVAGDDLATKKPNKTNIDLCCNYYGVDNDQTFMVGDSSVDQELAMNANVKFILFKSGYDDGVDKDLVNFMFSDHCQFLKLWSKKVAINE